MILERKNKVFFWRLVVEISFLLFYMLRFACGAFLGSVVFLLRLARARPYFCLPAAKVGKTASSSAVLDTYRLDI
jgi:hypothetical protein